VSQRIAEAVFAALGTAIPEQLFGAPAGTSGNLGVGGFDPLKKRAYVMYVISGGGYGGSPAGDGISNGCSTIGISKTTPIEIMEQLYPVLFEEYSLHEGSGGAGEHRGGFGVNYRIRLRRGSATVSMVMDHGRAGPPGAQGGAAGGTNKVRVIRNGVTYVPPHLSKDQDIEIHAGDVIAVSTPGGGGFGPPSARPGAAVGRDLALGYYTAEEAERAFASAGSRRWAMPQ
jgi:N-methylhydantoinase B